MLQIINVQKILINNDLLSSKQKKKIYANKNINDRKLSYASELFKFNLAKKNKININTLVNIKKPHFKNSNVHFSISHSFPYFVAISSLNHKVGIDIEKIQPVKYFDISKRLYNDYENSILLKSRNKLEMFYKI
jgi:phosphopantetheinyl transferase